MTQGVPCYRAGQSCAIIYDAAYCDAVRIVTTNFDDIFNLIRSFMPDLVPFAGGLSHYDAIVVFAGWPCAAIETSSRASHVANHVFFMWAPLHWLC